MPTTTAASPAAAGAIPDPCPPLVRLASAGRDALIDTEWLLTDGLGGFAMGTASGVPTRRYHGLLVAALSPPVQREILWHSVVDRLVIGSGEGRQRVYNLGAYRFHDGTLHPHGLDHLVRFETNSTSCRWTFRCGEAQVVRTLRLGRGASAAELSYEVTGLADLARLEVRPMTPLRDAHELHRCVSAATEYAWSHEGLAVRVTRRGRVVELAADAGYFEPGVQWWYDFKYAVETSRGLDDEEDLYSPGAFVLQARAGQQALRLSITGRAVEPRSPIVEPPAGPGWSAERERAQRTRLGEMAATVLSPLPPSTPEADRRAIARLVAATDAFVVRRAHGLKNAGVSIIAGYPWFTDWGRDSMISMNGLLLAAQRFGEARLLLETFASHLKHGLVPNVFNDQTGEAWYNTADASMWFLHAACEYLRLTGDRAGFDGVIRKACHEIIAAHRAGTGTQAEGVAFRIAMDPADGLISAGDEKTQLTWMDAKREGVVFTPRYGKAVEINALWHHGLVSVASAVEKAEPALAADYRALAARVAESFRAQFWNPARECLFDVLTPTIEKGTPPGAASAAPSTSARPGTPASKPAAARPTAGAARTVWTPDPRVRPNQIFAASLEHSPLTPAQRAAVLAMVGRELLTPLGLRTLAPGEAGYRPRFTGRMMERDAAYHNGTVWPWLIGAYAEAVLRVGGFSPAARAQARAALQALLEQLDGASLGQIYEVFDGDEAPGAPRVPGGCMAQAWSVAETLRAMLLVHAGK